MGAYSIIIPVRSNTISPVGIIRGPVSIQTEEEQCKGCGHIKPVEDACKYCGSV